MLLEILLLSLISITEALSPLNAFNALQISEKTSEDSICATRVAELSWTLDNSYSYQTFSIELPFAEVDPSSNMQLISSQGVTLGNCIATHSESTGGDVLTCSIGAVNTESHGVLTLDFTFDVQLLNTRPAGLDYLHLGLNSINWAGNDASFSIGESPKLNAEGLRKRALTVLTSTYACEIAEESTSIPEFPMLPKRADSTVSTWDCDCTDGPNVINYAGICTSIWTSSIEDSSSVVSTSVETTSSATSSVVSSLTMPTSESSSVEPSSTSELITSTSEPEAPPACPVTEYETTINNEVTIVTTNICQESSNAEIVVVSSSSDSITTSVFTSSAVSLTESTSVVPSTVLDSSSQIESSSVIASSEASSSQISTQSSSVSSPAESSIEFESSLLSTSTEVSSTSGESTTIPQSSSLLSSTSKTSESPNISNEPSNSSSSVKSFTSILPPITSSYPSSEIMNTTYSETVITSTITTTYQETFETTTTTSTFHQTYETTLCEHCGKGTETIAKPDEPTIQSQPTTNEKPNATTKNITRKTKETQTATLNTHVPTIKTATKPLLNTDLIVTTKSTGTKTTISTNTITNVGTLQFTTSKPTYNTHTDTIRVSTFEGAGNKAKVIQPVLIAICLIFF